MAINKVERAKTIRERILEDEREVRQMVDKLRRTLRMKCPSCGCWNRVPVNKIFVEQNSPEPKVKTFISMYDPMETVKCKKCGKIIAEPKELIRIIKQS